ncbi:MAG: hypothetical protein QGD88_10750 [Anaerolineae bacterium]|nr:hypothetical protein [Anaerolineae bacterium]
MAIVLSCLRRIPKACTMTSVNANAMRILLIIFLWAYFLLALAYLQRRKMSTWLLVFWGTFALLLPGFGPFFVIALQPGELIPHRAKHSKKTQI